jgi:hypothetical protein
MKQSHLAYPERSVGHPGGQRLCLHELCVETAAIAARAPHAIHVAGVPKQSIRLAIASSSCQRSAQQVDLTQFI